MSRGIAPDQAVSFVAHLLDITEIELFRRSWQEWHGEPPVESDVVNDFTAYLDRGTVPYYVSSYTRRILADEKLLARERKTRVRMLVIYYVPLIIFFVIIMYFLLT